MPNIGTLDRAIRILVGIALLSLTVIGPQTAWGLLGAIPLLTALVGICPVYSLLGISTSKGADRPATHQRG